PGVLILEALAQTGAIAVLGMEANKGKIGFLAGVDKCRFKRQVTPGDQLQLEVDIMRMKGPGGTGKGIATVNGEVASEAGNTLALTLVSACGTTNNDNNDPVEDETPIEEDNNGDNNGDMNENEGNMDREPADDNTLDRDPDSENRLDDGDDNLDETDEDRMNEKQNDDATE